MLLVIMLSVVVSVTWEMFVLDKASKHMSLLILYVLYAALMVLIGIAIGLLIVG